VPWSDRIGVEREQPGEPEVAGVLIADVERDRGGIDQRRHGFDRSLQDVAGRPELGQLLRESEERRRRLRRLSFRLQELRVGDRDRGVGCEDLEEPLVLFIERAVAEAREDDHTLDRLADRHRDGEHRFQDVFGVRDLDGERHEPRIRGQDGGPMFRDPPGDALPDLSDQLLERLVRVLVEDLASERDGQQSPPVFLHHVDPAIVIVEDRSELFGDRGSDLRHVVHARQGGGHAVQHVELCDEAEISRRRGCLFDVIASCHGPRPS
jgi:hypothetical protein